MSNENIKYPLPSYYETIISILTKNDMVALYDESWKYLFKWPISNFTPPHHNIKIWGIEINWERVVRFWPWDDHWFVNRSKIPHFINLLVKRKIQVSTNSTKNSIEEVLNENNNDYSEFTFKNGETDVGTFWYQYRNKAIKILKEAGQYQYWKYRLYFDIWFEDFEKLRDIIIEICSKEKIAIEFKYLDKEKSHISDTNEESTTTHFVANFKDIEDAKKLYNILSQNNSYKKIKGDKKREYDGYRIDEKVTYGNEYREQRAALWQIIKTSHFVNDHTVEYTRLNGKPMRITIAEYYNFKDQFANLQESLKEWEK